MDAFVNVTVVPGVMLVWLAVKLTVEAVCTITVIVAVLEPYRFIAFNVTVYVPALGKVWFSGSWSDDVDVAAKRIGECPEPRRRVAAGRVAELHVERRRPR